ncbi:MAG: type II secretion system protein GspC [Gammaproteobacteria bacterium]|nr:MAG: type II secretion system protein GspC [Gammaproteobacteria bacterium]
MNHLLQLANKESITRFSRELAMSSKFASATSWFILLIIIYMLASFSWAIWDYLQPRQAISISSFNNQTSQQQSPKLNVNKIISFNLFGNAKSEPKKVVETGQLDAPVTRLNLKLRGVYAASEENLAGAMIEANNKQEVYRIGSKLPGASGLKLHKIMSDRVIMSRGGRYETLLIEDFGKLGNSNSNSTRKVTSRRNKSNSNNTAMTIDKRPSTGAKTIDKRNDKNLTKELLKLRSNLSDPQSLSELVSISAATKDGNFQGFRIAPGKNRALFGRLGLRRNDILTQVNGISLDDPSTALSLMEQFKSAEEINLTIKRGNKDMNIVFSAQSQ